MSIVVVWRWKERYKLWEIYRTYRTARHAIACVERMGPGYVYNHCWPIKPELPQ